MFITIISGMVAVILAVPQLKVMVFGKTDDKFVLTNKELLQRLFKGTYDEVTKSIIRDSSKVEFYTRVKSRQKYMTADKKEHLVVFFEESSDDSCDACDRQVFSIATFLMDEPGKGTLTGFKNRLLAIEVGENLNRYEIHQIGSNNFGLLLQVEKSAGDDNNQPIEWHLFQLETLIPLLNEVVSYFNSYEDLEGPDDDINPAIRFWPEIAFGNQYKDDEYYDIKIYFKGKTPRRRLVDGEKFYFTTNYYTFDYNNMVYDQVQGDYYESW
ncbi:MAG TPA: hypothetical protein VHK91_02495 [Flavisolibacter sp.]|nr:hypothetical protein [Flavisolibacter sp.]